MLPDKSVNRTIDHSFPLPTLRTVVAKRQFNYALEIIGGHHGI